MRDPAKQFPDDPSEANRLDPMLRDIAVPTLEAGAHKDELRQLLLRELNREHGREHGGDGKRGELRESRGHSGGSSSTAAAADPSRAAVQGRGGAWPWRPRLGFALLLGGAVAAMVVIALSMRWMQNGGSESSGVASVPHSTTQGFTAAITGSNLAPSAQGDAVKIADAIENGDFDLALTITSRYGGRVYVYRVKLADASFAFFANDHVMPGGAQPRLHRAQELQLDIETARGRYIVEQKPINLGGAKLYRYRLNMSDGTQQEYLSDLEPDAGVRQRRQSELGKLMNQGAGEIFGTIPGPDDGSVNLIRVTLRDGTVRVYANSKGKPESR